MSVKIGTCGFRNSKYEYAEVLHTVEIQHTFYNPPKPSTLEGWRAELPEPFEFTLKAWQLITHESSSPTYKRLRRKLDDKEASEAGFFKPTEIVEEAYERSIESATALKARTMLFQCPAKFTPTKENIKNMRSFFKKADRKGLNFAWEPRGDWEPTVVRKLCSDLDLWHAVDPLKTTTQTPEKCYFRLHGRVRWRYTYEDGEMEELATLLPHDSTSYVFFNNVTMIEDAVRFSKIVADNR